MTKNIFDKNFLKYFVNIFSWIELVQNRSYFGSTLTLKQDASYKKITEAMFISF